MTATAEAGFSLSGELNFMRFASLSRFLRYSRIPAALAAAMSAKAAVPARAINRILHQVHHDLDVVTAAAGHAEPLMHIHCAPVNLAHCKPE